eukprot:6202565-Pleurochrysis_carterae.AAC.1
MEGDKGGAAHGRWYTGSRTGKQRWEDYKAFRRARNLPIIGSECLFQILWSQHGEIKEYTAKSHPKCDQCGLLEPRLDQIGERTDPEAANERKPCMMQSTLVNVSMRTTFCIADRLTKSNARQSIPMRKRSTNLTARFGGATRAPPSSRWTLIVNGSPRSMAPWFLVLASCATSHALPLARVYANLVLTVLMLVLERTAQAGVYNLYIRSVASVCAACRHMCSYILDMSQRFAWVRRCSRSSLTTHVGHTFSILHQSLSALIKCLKRHAVYIVSSL